MRGERGEGKGLWSGLSSGAMVFVFFFFELVGNDCTLSLTR